MEAGAGLSALRYHHESVDLSVVNSAHTQMVLLVREDKKVLEVGPATGYLTRVLTGRGCKVTCVERDPAAAAVAAASCERMLVGDVEQPALRDVLQGERFDVVLFGDVLEHLVDPWQVLREVLPLLAPGGYVVASVPNIAHGSIRLTLLQGRFRYTDAGLLDRTHLRFFTRDSLEALFRDSGYTIEVWQPILLDPLAVEQQVDADDFPAGLIQCLREDETALAYQYVVRAVPISEDKPLRLSAPSMGSAASQYLEQLRAAEQLRIAERLEQERSALRQQLESMRSSWSWQLTAPLRGARSALAALRQR